MTRSDQGKLLGVLFVTALSLYCLFPSYQYYSMKPEQRQATDAAKMAKLRKGAIKLGLDLQGGLQLLLEVDTQGLKPAEAADAVSRSREIINNRIDQFGVAEPSIQVEGDNRIAVQLPGLTDRASAIELIGKTALLEFKLVRTDAETQAVLTRLDQFLAGKVPSDSLLRNTPFTGLLAGGIVREEDQSRIEAMLAMPGVAQMLPSDTQLLWGAPETVDGRTSRGLYVVKATAEMTGGSIQDARPNPSQDRPGRTDVTLDFTPSGRSEFARVTGNNVNRRLAIVLDGVVQSAPNIQERIAGGNARISGDFSVETAKQLAIVLRAGALPRAIHILEERSVGPSLGSDSIREGVTAGLIGTAMVVVFMALYYQLSGLIAIAALVLNLLYLVAGMAALGSTLTLPGIAGIVLTVGMAVDTNVLIFERIREEIRRGRSIHDSVRLGYDRAFRTIFDAHSTTLISALFLFQFGTGPIKGFAVTLSLGLIANLFTAVVFTRMIYDFWLGRGKVDRLSI